MKWTGGKVPTAIFMDGAGEVIKEEPLPDKDKDGLKEWFAEHGFSLQTKLPLFTTPPETTQEFGGAVYQWYSEALSFDWATEAASFKTGHLATPRTQAEVDFLLSLLPEGVEAWLGGHDRDAEGTWVWNQGSLEGSTFWPATSENGEAFWKEGEPNNAGGKEHCLVLSHAGFLDTDCANKMGALVRLAAPSTSTHDKEEL